MIQKSKFGDYQATELIEAFGKRKPVTVLAGSPEKAKTYLKLIQEHAKLFEKRSNKIANYKP
jgi:hypothetical protein